MASQIPEEAPGPRAEVPRLPWADMSHPFRILDRRLVTSSPTCLSHGLLTSAVTLGWYVASFQDFDRSETRDRLLHGWVH